MAENSQFIYTKAGSSSGADPSLLSAAATNMATRTALMRAVYGGTETMRDESDLYLPQAEAESDTRYEARVSYTTAVNKVREAVESSSAKPFKTMIKLINNTDPDLDLWIKDIDLKRNHLHVFGHAFFNDAVAIGQSHFIVDNPTTATFTSLGAQRAANVRPFFKAVKDDALIAAYTTVVQGQEIVWHARFRGSRTTLGGDFKEVVYNQIWVIEVDPTKVDPTSPKANGNAGISQLWEQEASGGAGGEWKLMGEVPISINEVPLVSLFCGEKEADYQTKPYFLDLAYKQIEHFGSSSEQRNILTAARFPMLAASGVEFNDEDEAKMTIGPWKFLYSPEAGGRFYYVETKGTAIEQGFKDLAMLELQMDMMALNPTVVSNRQYVPQDEIDTKETRVHSVIHDWAISARDAISKGVGFMGKWAGKDFSAVTVDLDTNFDNTANVVGELTLLLSAYEKKGISRQTFLQEARGRNLLSDDFDIKAELQLMAAVDAAALAAENLNSNGGVSQPTTSTTAPKTDFPTKSTRPTTQV